MNNAEFKRLVEPLCMLTGYCKSAADITPGRNLEKWSTYLIQLAQNLDNAWDEVISNEYSATDANTSCVKHETGVNMENGQQ